MGPNLCVSDKKKNSVHVILKKFLKYRKVHISKNGEVKMRGG